MPSKPDTSQSILVIRLSAFGDVVSCLPAMQGIRTQNPNARITLLTLPLFARLLAKCPLFDQIRAIERWPFYNFMAWIKFARSLSEFDIVYDLQGNDRTLIFSHLAPARLRKAWFGRKGHPEQALGTKLDYSKVPTLWETDFSWMGADISHLPLKAPYALLVPGCAPQHPYKRWPAKSFALVAQQLLAMGIQPILIGSSAEQTEMAYIETHVSGSLNLCNKTSFDEMAEIARGACVAIGNDTGPMHLISAVGCPVISLFSGKTQPEQSAPRGKIVQCLQAEPIENIEVGAIMGAVRSMLEPC